MLRVAQISLCGILVVLLSSCGGFRSTGNYDSSMNPLDSPGSERRGAAGEDSSGYAPGSYVEVTDVNAGLYFRFPGADSQPDETLALGTPLKVINERGSYLRVETASGQIGYVPTIMVSNSVSSQGVIGSAAGGGLHPPRPRETPRTHPVRKIPRLIWGATLRFWRQNQRCLPFPWKGPRPRRPGLPRRRSRKKAEDVTEAEEPFRFSALGGPVRQRFWRVCLIASKSG